MQRAADGRHVCRLDADHEGEKDEFHAEKRGVCGGNTDSAPAYRRRRGSFAIAVVVGRAQTGGRAGLVKTLAKHDDVDALWAFGSKEASTLAEKLSVGNLKRTLVDHGLMLDWHDPAACKGPILLRHAVQVKNIWIPYGD